MVTIRTKKIATATTPTPHYPITNVVSIVRGLGPSSTKLGMALAKVHCLSCFQQFSIPFHSATPNCSQSHVSTHDIIPGSGGNTFHQAITTGLNEEYSRSPRWTRGSPRMLLVLVRESESHRGEILTLLAKIKKDHW